MAAPAAATAANEQKSPSSEPSVDPIELATTHRHVSLRSLGAFVDPATGGLKNASSAQAFVDSLKDVQSRVARAAAAGVVAATAVPETREALASAKAAKLFRRWLDEAVSDGAPTDASLCLRALCSIPGGTAPKGAARAAQAFPALEPIVDAAMRVWGLADYDNDGGYYGDEEEEGERREGALAAAVAARQQQLESLGNQRSTRGGGLGGLGRYAPSLSPTPPPRGGRGTSPAVPRSAAAAGAATAAGLVGVLPAGETAKALSAISTSLKRASAAGGIAASKAPAPAPPPPPPAAKKAKTADDNEGDDGAAAATAAAAAALVSPSAANATTAAVPEVDEDVAAALAAATEVDVVPTLDV